MKKKSLGKKFRDWGSYFILAVISFILVFPILYMLTNSFMDSREVVETYSVLDEQKESERSAVKDIGFKMIPDRVSGIQYYNVLLRRPRFLLMFWNSVIITAPIVAGQVLLSSLAAFAFAKLRFPYRDKLFFVYIIVMMMPYQVTLVPNYITLKLSGLLDSFQAIILPGVFAAFGVFLLKQFMRYIPDAYCEAARMDGAGYFRTFTDVILPQCKSAVASLAILVFVDNWNMVEQPLIFLKDESMYPLSVFMNRINSEDLGLAFACGFIYMLPVILIFFYGENYLIEGIQLSGIK